MSSSLIVEICDIKDIKQHPNADNLEILIIKGWECIVKKGEYKIGDNVLYVPPDTLVPENIIEQYNLRNYLAGSEKNRVKCIRLRGEMSYGLILPNIDNLPVGTETSERYGFKKYEPPLRTFMGDALPRDPYFDEFTDIENIKNFPDIFKEGEMVVATEKIDGLNFRNCAIKYDDGTIEYKAGSHRVVRKRPETEEEAKTSIYWYPFYQDCVKNLLSTLISDFNYEVKKTVILYGEVYGRVRGGLKSMNYGISNSLGFAAFSIKIDGKYVNWPYFKSLCDQFNVPTVPVVSIEEFNYEKMKKLSKGNSILAEQNGTEHLREGIVICSMEERKEFKTDRAILKLLNEDYLTLKNKKEEKGEIVDFKDE